MIKDDTIKAILSAYRKSQSVSNREKYILEEIFEKYLMPELGYKEELFRIMPLGNKKEYYIQNTENKEEKIGLLISVGDILPKDENALLDILEQCKMEWGIVTNGRNFVLINRGIQISKIENWKTKKTVLEVRIGDSTDMEYLKYFTRDELFMAKNALYFKDIAEYKNVQYRGNEESWGQYNSTLKRFFKSYIEKKGGNYNGYGKFKFADFESFILELNVKSPATIVNTYSHISVYLRDKIGMRTNGFELSRKDVLKLFTEVKKEELGDILDKRRLEEINKFFCRKRYHQIRNLSIFYLAICYGIERRQICQLQWSDIDFENGEITLEGRRKPLPKQLEMLLKKLESENAAKGCPKDFVFYVNRKGKFCPIKKDAVNGVFSSLAEINRYDPVYTQYSPAKIRRTLAGILIKELPLEEVMYLLSIDADNLGRYLNTEEIFAIAKTNLDKKKENGKWHPMESVLEGVL